MSILFEPARMGPVVLKNRFVRSATSDNLAGDHGWPSKKMIALYAELARGEIGMINTGVIRPRNSWFGRYNVLTLQDRRGVAAFKKLTESVHEHGAKITAQLTPYFARNGRYLAPTSPLPGLKGNDPQPVEATIEDIQHVVRTYGHLAALVRESNFDAVQIHAAHGYGLHQFLSPYMNRRTDEYGGTVANRCRIIAEIRTAISRDAGSDFPVWIKLTTGDFLDGAMDISDAVAVAMLLETYGFFAVEPSCGSLIGNWKSRGPNDKRDWKEAYNLERIEKIKENVHIPVVAVGGLRRLDAIESIIKTGQADFAAMSRPFLREPDLVERWKSGDSSPSKCSTCNACFDLFWSLKPLKCKRTKNSETM
jgi:2,4-dienoyl-CoA reductase-like NADH-dependent reductase (Old Yellow Enzyme family)